MTKGEALVYAAAFALAVEKVVKLEDAAHSAQQAVQALRNISAGPPDGRNAWQRMLTEFRFDDAEATE